MNITVINSRTIVAKVPRFSGSLIEVADIARKSGQYGNILGYEIKHSAGASEVVFKLDKPYQKVAIDSIMSNNPQEGQLYINPETGQTLELADQMNEGSQQPVMQLKDPDSPDQPVYVTQQEFQTAYQPVQGTGM